MTREEAIANGYELHETKHSMKRRMTGHDYSNKGTYMLTLVVRGRKPLLGTLAGDLDAPTGSANAPHVELSELGKAIRDEEIKKIEQFYPMVKVWRLCIMPDHLHMIVRVERAMDKGKHLGLVVAGFKGGCSKAAMALGAVVPCASAQENDQGERPGKKGLDCTTSGNGSRDAKSKVIPLYEDGYNDKVLLHKGQLDNWKLYLADNPRRLMVKRSHPNYFTVLDGMVVTGEHCQVVGNRFLLDIPDKVAVIVHRRYTDEDVARLRDEWLACGERGGVLVSAAIAQKEKEVMREAMNRGYSIILLRENGFPKLYKPSGESFDACAQGSLLMISPWDYHMDRKVISRQQCLYLNAMAERIVGK